MSHHRNCIKKSLLSKSSKTKNENQYIRRFSNSHSSLTKTITPKKETVILDSNSLISLCSPFTFPPDTKHHIYKIQKDKFNNSNISLAVIYGDISEPPLQSAVKMDNTTTAHYMNNIFASQHYKTSNKKKHLQSIMNSVLLLDEIENNKLYYNAVIEAENIETLIPELDIDMLVTDYGSDIESDYEIEATQFDRAPSSCFVSSSASTKFHLGTTDLLQDRLYEKTVLDMDNDFNMDFANILSEIDIHVAGSQESTI